MDDASVPEQVGALLTQIASLIGTNSPSPNTSQNLGNLSSPQFQQPFTPTRFNNIRPPFQPSVPRASGSVIAEVRARFSPYLDNGRVRLAGRSAQGRRSAPVVQIRNWSNRVFCLAYSNQQTTPTLADRLTLSQNGLGESVVTTVSTATSIELKEAIHETFIKLQGLDFELVRGISGGFGKPLVRISPTIAIPSVEYLKAARISTIFIRPLTDILLNEDIEDLHEPGRSQIPPPQETSDQDNESHTNLNQTIVTEARASTSSDSFDFEEDAKDGLEVVESMLDYRAHLYEKNPGVQYIGISRGEFLEKIFGVYKDPNFNFLKKPHVEFLGEAGTDVGALTREYFWKGLMSLTHNKIDGKHLFEGSMDHYVPTMDSRLVRGGVFRTVGRFMAHATIHCGIGFIGLSEAVVEYLTTETVDFDTPFTVHVDDIPDLDIREAICKIRSLESGATLNEEERRGVQEVALSAEFNQVVNLCNSKEAVDQILYHQVIERRKPCLDAIKSAFSQIGILQFLKNKSYLLPGIFPRNNDTKYPAELIIGKIVCNGSEEIFGYVKNFIENLDDGDKIQKLLSAWTGWPIIPDSPLQINIVDDCDFKAHTCFNMIEIPSNIRQEEVINMFNLLIEHGFEGFGAV